jgi:hypothetical protein
MISKLAGFAINHGWKSNHGDKSGLFGGGKFRDKLDRSDKSGFLGGGKFGDKLDRGDKSGLFGGGKFGDKLDRGDKNGFSGGGCKSDKIPPSSANQIIQGTAANDSLTGNNSGRDTLVGTTEVARGLGERDILIGGRASDTFVLGDASGSYYIGQKDSDFAQIQNFNRCNDAIQLAGSAQDYSISYANGISSIYQKDACGCTDLVATVDSGCNPLDLSAKYFQFIPQSNNVAFSSF